MTDASTIDNNEITKFEAIAEEWWDETGKFAPLHKLNPIRISYIREKTCQHFGIDFNHVKPFTNLDLIDIGCGGGLLSEPMCRLGANVTGIDASDKNINIARLHARNMQLNINYIHTTVEKMAAENKQFDVILNMEVIEHVANPALFLESCCKLLKPDGIMFIATINRTIKSYTMAIIGAEYILNWLPKGTHSWNKFLKPSQIAMMLEQNQLKLNNIHGFVYNMLNNSWKISKDTDVNYILTAVKTT